MYMRRIADKITDMYYAYFISPVGRLTICASDNFIQGLWIKDQKYFDKSILSDMIFSDTNAVIRQAFDWLDAYFSGCMVSPGDLPLSPCGSEFRLAVWDILLDIPYGQTTTYGSIAKKIASQKGQKHMSAQAVGGAIGHNPIAIIIPCHRVLSSDGSICGYAAGVEVKRWLLNHEKNHSL